MKQLLQIFLLLPFFSFGQDGQTFDYKGEKLKLLHFEPNNILYDTIIFNKTHDTAFIYRAKKVLHTSQMLVINDTSNTFIGDTTFSINYDSVNYRTQYKKYKVYHRKKIYHNINYYYNTDYSKLTRPVNVRIFHYRWWYDNGTETASGENYITLKRPPSKKYIRSLIARSFTKKNISFEIEEL